jgi:hypothetical protein
MAQALTTLASKPINSNKGPTVMQLVQNTHIAFTPAARAVLGPAKYPEGLLTPAHRFSQSVQHGDLVQLADCSAFFVVLSRSWTVGTTRETLTVLLDLTTEPQPLSAVLPP